MKSIDHFVMLTVLKLRFTKVKFLCSVSTLLLCSACISISAADQLQPFRSDGCSVFPDGTLTEKNLWLSCCTDHDIAYWKGGTREEKIAADLALRQCVEALGQPTIAKLMQTGVRVGGSPYLPTGFRWGYGWKQRRAYKPLSQPEQLQADKLLKHYYEELQKNKNKEKKTQTEKRKSSSDLQ